MSETPESPGEPVRALRFLRAQRIARRADFQRIYRAGSRARGALMTVVAAPNELGLTRLGLSVGKVVWKSAVRRNRVRRVFREAFRLEQHALPAGVDFVLIGSTPRLEPELAAVRDELRRLAAKAWRRCREKSASG
jgi:ribonuclease P protein component